MRSKKYYKIAGIIAAIGLILILIVVLSDSAYPSMVFRVLAPLGMLLVFISIALLGISWFFKLKESVARKDYISTVIIIAIGFLFLFKALKHWV